MESYIIEWLSLIFRWLHVVTGVAWIGASFYFIWLDNHLKEPPSWKRKKGIKGDLWAIHGGGIYEIAKYKLAPEEMPEMLHWFKWEAYSTWLTGMVLLTLIYYLGAESYLIDPSVAELEHWEAVFLGLGFIIGSYIFYELLCLSPLGKNSYLLASVLIIAGTWLSFALTQTFSGRGAYIHFGAIIGTLMVGNVFRVIMPSQRALINAINENEPLDSKWGTKAKLHSTHNTYLTLPLIFIMISSHYPMTYGHSFNWLILIAIIAITAVTRHFFIHRHKKISKPFILIGAAASTIMLAIIISPPSPKRALTMDANQLADLATNAQNVIQMRCNSCHSSNPTDDVFVTAPGGVKFDTLAEAKQWSARIKARAVDTTDMPFMNKTGMLDEERTVLENWILSGSPIAQ